MYRATVTFEVTATIELFDEVVGRCVENLDEDANPQPDVQGGTGWRNMYYDLRTADAVAQHIAFNCALNDRPLSTLDGWADLPAEAVKVLSVQYDPVASTVTAGAE